MIQCPVGQTCDLTLTNKKPIKLHVKFYWLIESHVFWIFGRKKYSKMSRAKKNFIRLQEYNKRRQLSFDEKEKTETNENTGSIEREEKEIELEEKT